MNAKYLSELSRAVLKIGLECAYLDHRDELFASRFDYVRGVVVNILGAVVLAHAAGQPIAPTPGFFIGRF